MTVERGVSKHYIGPVIRPCQPAQHRPCQPRVGVLTLSDP